MLCATCHRQLAPAAVCRTCGTPAPGAGPALQLVLPDGTGVAIVDAMTVGRAAGSTLCLDDPSVSRTHARIHAGRDGEPPSLEDAGSSYGTFLDDEPVTEPVALRAGSRIRIGDQLLKVQAALAVSDAERTIIVPVGASVVLPSAGTASVQHATAGIGQRPRLRSGYALKHLDNADGEDHWVVRDLKGGSFLRLSDADAQLMRKLDGSRSLAVLVGEAEREHGPGGIPALIRLLSELGERGLLADVAGGGAHADGEAGGWRRLLRPREKTFHGLGEAFGSIYRRGGWVLFTRPAITALWVLGVVGIGVFVALIAERYGTPFVVADRLLLGGLVFLAGRAALVVFHELAHGLAMESVGRHVDRAGVKLIFIFPYAFVDTSEVWFERRRRRRFVTLAGPLSDLALAGLFSILCLLLSEGSIRDIAFQVAFAGYVAAFFNLNPFLERDGYHLVADRLGVPGLRSKARAQLQRRLAGVPMEDADPALTRYAVTGLAWSFAFVGIAVVFMLRFQDTLEALASPTVVWIVFGTLWGAMLIPVFIVVGPPLLARLRGRGGELEAAS